MAGLPLSALPYPNPKESDSGNHSFSDLGSGLSLDCPPHQSSVSYRGVLRVTNRIRRDKALPSVQDQIFTNVADGGFSLATTGYDSVGLRPCANLGRVRLNTPKYRSISLPSLVPINTSLTVPSPVNIANLLNNPLPINAVDEIEIDTTNTSSSADTEAVIMGIGMATIPYTPGVMIRVRGTCAITCVAGTWVNGVMTLDQPLPAGYTP